MPFCGAAAIAHVSASVGPMTRHVHAFGDDALGDLDAVALVDALRTGKVSRPEVVEAAIARTKAVDPALNGLAHENFDQALARASPAQPRRLLRRRPNLYQGQRRRRGHADHAGHRRLGPQPPAGRRRVRAPAFRHRAGSGGQDPALGVRLQRFGRASQNRGGPQSVGYRLLRGRVIVGLGGFRRRRGGADRARQRRRRLDPNSGRLQRSCRVSSPPAAGCRWTVVAPDADQASSPTAF